MVIDDYIAANGNTNANNDHLMMMKMCVRSGIRFIDLIDPQLSWTQVPYISTQSSTLSTSQPPGGCEPAVIPTNR